MIFDLSHPLNKGMPVFPGDPEFSTEVIHDIPETDYRVTKWNINSHLGTHIDAPAHVLSNGKYLDEYSLKQFVGSCIIIHCVASDRIEWKIIENQLTEEIPDFLIFHTDHSLNWGKKEYFVNFPILSTEAANRLAAMPLKGIGIDSPGFDKNPLSLQMHKLFLKNDILLIENLTNLETIKQRNFTFHTIPLKFNCADGSPVRAYAVSSDIDI